MSRTIFLSFIFFITSEFYSQTAKDSVSLATDSTKSEIPSLNSTDRRNTFKSQYNSGVTYIVKTNMGMTYIGFIVEEAEYYIIVEDRISHERHELRRGEIVSIKVFSSKQSYLDLISENYHAGNYMLGSSAFLFKQGDVNSTYHWFLLDNLDYAITENFAISVTSLIIYPMAVGVKSAFQIDNMNYIGGNVFGIGNIFAGNNSGNGNTSVASSFFLGWGGIAKYTHGTSNQNITIASGLLALNSDVIFSSPSPTPFYNVFFSNVAYCSRLNEHVALNLEGWFLPKAQIGFAGVGFKLVANEESCWTLGCYGIVNFLNDQATFNYKALPIPYVGMTQKF